MDDQVSSSSQAAASFREALNRLAAAAVFDDDWRGEQLRAIELSEVLRADAGGDGRHIEALVHDLATKMEGCLRRRWRPT